MSSQVESKSNKQIKIGAIMSYITIAVNIVAGLLYTPWMLEQIGESVYGIYTLATSLISLFVMDFGISAASAKFIAQYRADGEVDKINKFLGVVYKLYFILDVIIALIFTVVFFNVKTIYKNLGAEELNIFKTILLIVIFYNLIAFPFSPISGILNAYEEFFHVKFANCFNKVLTVIATVIVLLLNGGIYGLVIVHVVCNLLSVMYKLITVKLKTPVKTDFSYWGKGEVKSILSLSVWSTVISVMGRLVFNITPSVLAITTSSIAITVFGLASTLEGYVYTFSDGVNGLFLSKTVRATKSKEKDKNVLNLMIKVGRINLSIIALIVSGFIVAGNEFVLLWLGDGNQSVYICAVCMIIPDLIYFPQQIGRTTLIVEEKLKYQAIVYVIMGIVNIVLTSILSLFWGAKGAAISITVSYTIRLILMGIVFQKVLKIKMFEFYKKCYISMILPFLLTLIIGFMVFKYMVVHSWLVFLVKCAIVALVYVVSMWLIAWNKEEKTLIKNVIMAVLSKVLRKKGGKKA